MVAAVHFYATESDQHALLDYLGEPDTVSLHPWPVIGPTIERLDRATALRTAQVMVAHADFGPPVGVRPASDGWASDIRAQVFNTLNWDRLRPAEDEALVDSNASPVLFWQPAAVTDGVLRAGNIGSQADSMAAVSADYERWVKRVMNWVRRQSERVWGLERGDLRPAFDIDIAHVSAVYALPGARAALASGTQGR